MGFLFGIFLCFGPNDVYIHRTEGYGHSSAGQLIVMNSHLF